MATFIPEVSPYKRKDNTYLIKVRVTHNRKTLRKPLGVYATPEQLNRDRDRIKDPALLEAVNKAIEMLRLAAANIEGAEFLPVADLWRAIVARMKAEKGFVLEFFGFSEQLIKGMEKGTASGYIYALRAFSAYLGRGKVDVNEIDRATVAGFREWIEKKNGKGCRASSAYLEKLRHLHNEARAKFNDDDVGLVRIPRQPFKGMIPPQPAPAHRALTLEQLRRVLAVSPVTSRGRLARDVFFLSFALVGINTADLYAMKKQDLRGGVLTYNRAKTDSRRADRATMRVKVEPEAKALIEYYRGQNTLLSFADRFSDAAHFNKACNMGLREVARLAGVAHLTTYHARHTWATLARNEAGVSFDVVSEALNHARRGAERVTDIYLERDFSRVWAANRAVLDLLLQVQK